ncbi:hypothetical protein [Kribbella sindirgiensis]|uniref:hypothetical protein n=1 Tax=Kribbella sindirgiensis TaxID=1124744 RepID=UPI0013F3BEFB|nr:hypothetical protein [Kribbella sindirgiensis]
MEYLKEEQIEQVLSVDSAWMVGYAPDTLTSLVDHLAAENFAYSTMESAGLIDRVGDGAVTDRFRDQLVLVARDAHLHPTGFIGIGRDGRAHSLSPATAIHQPSNVLVGIAEQLDLLRGGAVPVLVDDLVDAIAVSSMSRETDGQWVGIPVFGAGLSTAQARMLRKFSLGDTVIVVAHGDEHRRKLTTGYLFDLALYYDRVRAVVLPHSPSSIVNAEHGPQTMNDLLTTVRPSLTYRFGGAVAAELMGYPEPPDRGPDL